MKTNPSKIALVTATLGLVLAGFAAPKANAGHGDDLIRLTHSLENIVSELRHEFHAHYRHTSVYRHLMSDAAKIEDEAEHIHHLAHDPYASLRHLRTDVAQLDELAHHLHDLIDATERGRYGHVHGDTHHVHEMMTALTRVLHRLEDEIDDLARGHGSGHGHGHGSHGDYRHRGYSESSHFSRGGFRFSFYR